MMSTQIITIYMNGKPVSRVVAECPKQLQRRLEAVLFFVKPLLHKFNFRMEYEIGDKKGATLITEESIESIQQLQFE